MTSTHTTQPVRQLRKKQEETPDPMTTSIRELRQELDETRLQYAEMRHRYTRLPPGLAKKMLRFDMLHLVQRRAVLHERNQELMRIASRR